LELDKVLGFAVILAWDDLKKATNPSSVRVEFQNAAGKAVDYLSIWSVDAEAHQSMLCDYWTWVSSAHSSGISFKKDCRSQRLGQALDFILMNQNQFTRPSDACPEGLALVYPPNADELAEATTWMAGVHGVSPNVSPAGDARVATLQGEQNLARA
jgi:hypothetical protein